LDLTVLSSTLLALPGPICDRDPVPGRPNRLAFSLFNPVKSAQAMRH
jgi:hypothetical protein